MDACNKPIVACATIEGKNLEAALPKAREVPAILMHGHEDLDNKKKIEPAVMAIFPHRYVIYRVDRLTLSLEYTGKYTK